MRRGLISRSETELPDAVFDARIARVRDIDVVRIAGHHHLHLDDPQPVASAILAFHGKR